jgi:transposase
MATALIDKTKRLPGYVTFQDEARFGMLSDPKRCWAPLSYRHTVRKALVREYEVYIFGAIAPKTGQLDYMMGDNMKAESMSLFLRHVRKNHQNKFIIMVVDGASSHVSDKLVIPANMALITLPPYSPELNPAEQIWNILRRNYFSNNYFSSLKEAMDQAEYGLDELKQDRKSLISLTNWPWIDSIINCH